MSSEVWTVVEGPERVVSIHTTQRGAMLAMYLVATQNYRDRMTLSLPLDVDLCPKASPSIRVGSNNFWVEKREVVA